MTTKTITLRLNEDLHRKLKVKVAQEDLKIQEYVADLIENDMKKDSNKKQTL